MINPNLTFLIIIAAAIIIWDIARFLIGGRPATISDYIRAREKVLWWLSYVLTFGAGLLAGHLFLFPRSA